MVQEVGGTLTSQKGAQNVKPLYSLTAAGLLTGVLLFGRIAPAFAHADLQTCPAEQCFAAVVKDWPHFDVGSRGPGYGFATHGPIEVLTPAP